jgi:hypothetical protein
MDNMLLPFVRVVTRKILSDPGDDVPPPFIARCTGTQRCEYACGIVMPLPLLDQHPGV